MSNQTNSNLLEEARFYTEYFENKLPAQLIGRDIKNKDLESLAVHVKQARDLAFDLEYTPDER